MTDHPCVVILDDEPEIAAELSDCLTINGFSNLATSNPYHALKFIKSCASVKLVLLDRRMPIMDGYEFIKCAKKLLDHGRSVRFIIVTGHLAEADFNDATLNGADSVMSKPIDIDLLKITVQSAMCSA